MKKTAQKDTTPVTPTASDTSIEEVKEPEKDTIEEKTPVTDANDKPDTPTEEAKPEKVTREKKEEPEVEVEKDAPVAEKVISEKDEPKPQKKSFFYPARKIGELPSDVPTVDQNATLKIEDAKANEEDVPDIDKDSTLQVESVREVDEQVPIEKSNKKLFILGTGVFIAAVIVTLLAGLFILNSAGSKKTDVVKEEKKITETPTPVVTVVLKREDWSLEVLNGSGIAGEAKKAADKLTALGYKVVKTGNAEDSSGTQVFVSNKKTKEEKETFVKDLKEVLGEDVSLAEDLSGSTADAQIVLGK